MNGLCVPAAILYSGMNARVLLERRRGPSHPPDFVLELNPGARSCCHPTASALLWGR